jgi:hypothetical protein
VTITRNLKPSAQCLKAAKTAQMVLGQIIRAFHYRDRHVFVRLYIQYVRPHLEFAVAAWSPWSSADIECLEKVQKRAINMVSGLHSGVYEERLQELGLETLKERRHQIDMVQVYKILKGKDRVDKDCWFQLASDTGRVTRASGDPLGLKPQMARLAMRENFFSQRVVNAWNKIPTKLKNAATVRAFKNGYKKLRREWSLTMEVL